MTTIYFKRNEVENGMFQDTVSLNRLPDVDSWDFVEEFYPNYSSCADIAYLDDLTSFLYGDIDREQLTHRQPDTKGMRRTTIRKVYKQLYEYVRNKAAIHFYKLLYDGKISLFHSGKQIILDTSERKIYENSEAQRFYDYDIVGYGEVYRACVPYNVKLGDIFNIYLNGGTKHGCEWLGTLDKSLNKHLEQLEFETKNPIIMYKTIILNNIECVIQAYERGEFVNLCPIHPYISGVTIRFEPLDFGSWGHQNAAWRKYITGIDIEDLKTQLTNIVAINITGKDLKDGKQFQFTSSENNDNTDVAEISYSKHLSSFCIMFNAKLETFNTYRELKGRMNELTNNYKLDIVKERWQGEPSLADRIKSLKMYRDTRNFTLDADKEAYERTERQIEELNTKYYE